MAQSCWDSPASAEESTTCKLPKEQSKHEATPEAQRGKEYLLDILRANQQEVVRVLHLQRAVDLLLIGPEDVQQIFLAPLQVLSKANAGVGSMKVGFLLGMEVPYMYVPNQATASVCRWGHCKS